jgi:hypothetical protein
MSLSQRTKGSGNLSKKTGNMKERQSGKDKRYIDWKERRN